MWKLLGWFKRLQLWATGDWQLHHDHNGLQCARSCITSHAEFFGKTSDHPGDSAPLQSRFGALWPLAFPKTKITFERKRFQTISERFRKIWRGSWWRLVPRCLLWRGLRRHCPMYSVSRVSVDNELLEQCWPALFDVVNDPSVSILGKNRYLSIFLGFWLLISGNYFIYFF